MATSELTEPIRSRATKIQDLLLHNDLHVAVGIDQEGNVVVKLDRTDCDHFKRLLEDHLKMKAEAVTWLT